MTMVMLVVPYYWARGRTMQEALDNLHSLVHSKKKRETQVFVFTGEGDEEQICMTQMGYVQYPNTMEKHDLGMVKI